MAMLAIDMGSAAHITLASPNGSRRTYLDVMAYHLVRLFVQDVISVVRRDFLPSINSQLSNTHEQVKAHGQRRLDALSRWTKHDSPLSWEDGRTRATYTDLSILQNDDHMKP